MSNSYRYIKVRGSDDKIETTWLFVVVSLGILVFTMLASVSLGLCYCKCFSEANCTTTRPDAQPGKKTMDYNFTEACQGSSMTNQQCKAKCCEDQPVRAKVIISCSFFGTFIVIVCLASLVFNKLRKELQPKKEPTGRFIRR